MGDMPRCMKRNSRLAEFVEGKMFVCSSCRSSESGLMGLFRKEVAEQFVSEMDARKKALLEFTREYQTRLSQ